MSNTLPLNRNDFLGLDSATWLYNGAEAPPHVGVLAAVEDYVRSRAGGPNGRDRNALIEKSCKERLATLLNGSPENIALLSNASEAICAVALSIGLQPGDNVVINTLEYPSGVMAFLSQAADGVEIRTVEHNGWEVTPEAMLEQVDERTRLVMASHVSYLSGARLDYAKLYAGLQNTNALLLLDATQSFGVVPVDLQHADFVVSSTYKWILAMHGGGILAVNPARTEKVVSRSVGWKSVKDLFAVDRFTKVERHLDARQFELGYPAYTVVYGMNFSLGLLLEAGIENIEGHILPLGDQLIAGLDKLGLTVMTPRDGSRRAGNIAWVCERGEELANALRADNIFVWGGDGRTRASLHGYNTSSDVETLLAALERHRELF